MERDQIVGYLSAMTDTEYAALTSEARTQPPLTPIQQARAEGRAKAGRLLELRSESDERATDRARMSLSTTQSDQAAAAQAAQEAAWQATQTQAPQGFTPNRGQGAAGTPPPPTAETGAQKAGRLQQLHQQQQKGF